MGKKKKIRLADFYPINMSLIFFSSFLTLSLSSSVFSESSACGAICKILSEYKGLGSQCAEGSLIQLGNYAYYLNNQWNAGAAKPGYYQCLDGTTVSYSWWSADGLDDSVKAYPAIITGWHWGYLDGQGNANLPVLVSSSPTITVNWSVQHTNTGNYETYNTAFDIWLGDNGDMNPSGPTTEVMIWMNHVHQYPLGSFMETINIWGQNFDVWAHFGGSPAWNVFTFVQQQNTWSFNNVNLFPFFNYLWNTKQWIDGRQYIVGIEAGNEIIQGQGTFTHNYSLKIN